MALYFKRHVKGKPGNNWLHADWAGVDETTQRMKWCLSAVQYVSKWDRNCLELSTDSFQNASVFSRQSKGNQIEAKHISHVRMWRKWDLLKQDTEKTWQVLLTGHHHLRPFILFYWLGHHCQLCSSGPLCPCAVAAGEILGDLLFKETFKTLIHPIMKAKWLSSCMVAIFIIITYLRQN